MKFLSVFSCRKFWCFPLRGNINISAFNYSTFEYRDADIGNSDCISVKGVRYPKDDWTNVTEHIFSHVGRNLHLQNYHPLNTVKKRIVNFMYSRYVNRSGNPLFSVHDNINPVVSTFQNFDSLLIPGDHPSRRKNDNYYINANYLLRAHTSAHQFDFIRSGLNHFLIVGDVYRRDNIDSCHFPVFHQLEAVHLFSKHEVFRDEKKHGRLEIFEKGNRTENKQEDHSLEAVKLVEHSLKTCLIELAQTLLGKDIKYRWVSAYFPFTHPSFELEIEHGNEWIEILGCGIVEHKLLELAGAGDKIGWAFGLGLERLAMNLYDIPDIRLFWSRDSGFISQFQVDDLNAVIKFKPFGKCPQSYNDVSFWIPESFSENDFYELVRSIGKDLVEQVQCIDEYVNPQSKKTSHCYRITYRHMERTLTMNEVKKIHKQISDAAVLNLGVKLR